MGFFAALPGALSQGLIWGVMALGLFISYKILDFADLTVDGSFCTGAAVCAVLIKAGVNFALAMLIALIAGLLCGLMTGLFNTLFGIPPILAGILSQLSLWSINLKILGGSQVTINRNSVTLLINASNHLQAILIMVAIIGVLITLLYWFFGTRQGCAIRAIGCNEKMARAQGINVAINKNIGLMLSNGLVALSGALYAQYMGSTNINMGRGAIVTGLAAIIIGLAIIKWLPDNFVLKLVGVVVGAMIYFVVYQLIITFIFDTDLLKLLSALLVAIFLAIPHFKNKLVKRAVIGKQDEGGATKRRKVKKSKDANADEGDDKHVNEE